MKKKPMLQNFKIYVIGDAKAIERKNVTKAARESAKALLSRGERD